MSILVATHKRYDFPALDLYVPMQVGAQGKDKLGYACDNDGISISDKNASYCELTALYWQWKNDQSAIKGLVHYRRYFTSSSFSTTRFMSKNIIDEKGVDAALSKYDILIPKARSYFVFSVWQQYAIRHYSRDLRVARDVLAVMYPDYISAFDHVVSSRELVRFNMLIAKRSVYDKYCEWLFPLLGRIEQEIDVSNYDSYQQRVIGFLAERLFNVWLAYNANAVSVGRLDVVSLEKEKVVAKVVSFGAAFLRSHFGSKAP
ncbi:DUF4422 domain-containing protein [Granulosicoccaceae sp. 1_MG-2023]|nr:DUF4422 domain-containing protein [Granulosicoccaceae sp. 1_MG-2023]